jgi:rhamnosyl/mannosyltransferase
MMRFLRSADRILVASPNYLESSDVLQQVRARCVVLPYGIDRETFISGGGTESQALRARLGGGPIILFVGVLRYYKGVNYLIRAMANVDATLVVAGAGPMEAEWRALVRDLGLDARVHFAGRVPDEQLPSYYHAADIFCLPASERSEAFGLVQVEAMSSGLPIVSTDLGTGTSYVNMHGESGLVVPPRDPAALAAALNQLLADRMLCQELARGALQRSALFDVERMYRDVQQVYEELL